MDRDRLIREARKVSAIVNPDFIPTAIGGWAWLQTGRDDIAASELGLKTPRDVALSRMGTSSLNRAEDAAPVVLWLPEIAYLNPKSQPDGDGEWQFLTPKDRKQACDKYGDNAEYEMSSQPSALEIWEARAAEQRSDRVFANTVDVVWVPHPLNDDSDVIDGAQAVWDKHVNSSIASGPSEENAGRSRPADGIEELQTPGHAYEWEDEPEWPELTPLQSSMFVKLQTGLVQSSVFRKAKASIDFSDLGKTISTWYFCRAMLDEGRLIKRLCQLMPLNVLLAQGFNQFCCSLKGGIGKMRFVKSLADPKHPDWTRIFFASVAWSEDESTTYQEATPLTRSAMDSASISCHWHRPDTRVLTIAIAVGERVQGSETKLDFELEVDLFDFGRARSGKPCLRRQALVLFCTPKGILVPSFSALDAAEPDVTLSDRVDEEGRHFVTWTMDMDDAKMQKWTRDMTFLKNDRLSSKLHDLIGDVVRKDMAGSSEMLVRWSRLYKRRFVKNEHWSLEGGVGDVELPSEVIEVLPEDLADRSVVHPDPSEVPIFRVEGGLTCTMEQWDELMQTLAMD